MRVRIGRFRTNRWPSRAYSSLTKWSIGSRGVSVAVVDLNPKQDSRWKQVGEKSVGTKRIYDSGQVNHLNQVVCLFVSVCLVVVGSRWGWGRVLPFE